MPEHVLVPVLCSGAQAAVTPGDSSLHGPVPWRGCMQVQNEKECLQHPGIPCSPNPLPFLVEPAPNTALMWVGATLL